MEIKTWEELLEEIQKERDPQKLEKDFHLEDNFAMLLALTPPTRQKLELMLEELPKQEGFEINFQMFGLKKYLHGTACVQYSPRRWGVFVDIFEELTGIPSKSNAIMTFHSDGSSQALRCKDSVVYVSQKIMGLEIPFEIADPPARYTPKDTCERK